MRTFAPILLVATALLMAGCAGPERKFGRGVSNMTEIIQMREMRRSIEQTAIWDGKDSSFTTGVARGFNRTMARTFVGIYEVVTFPIPSYNPVLKQDGPIYPDYAIATHKEPFGGLVLPVKASYPESYTPARVASGLFDTDTYLGFSGGDVAPMIPGSRFHIFDH